MSDRAHALVKAFYHEPLREYRKAVLQVREQGGLAESELRFIERRVDPVDAEMIRRHATLDDESRRQE